MEWGKQIYTDNLKHSKGFADRHLLLQEFAFEFFLHNLLNQQYISESDSNLSYLRFFADS